MSGDGVSRIHATLVSIERLDGSMAGALLMGPPGSGKSDVALRLMDGGAWLVADDQVDITFGDGGLWGTAPESIAGLIEARGIGLIRLPYELRAKIAVVIELSPGGQIERMPERRWYQPPDNFRARGSALRIPVFTLDPFQISTPAKIRALLLGKLEG